MRTLRRAPVRRRSGCSVRSVRSVRSAGFVAVTGVAMLAVASCTQDDGGAAPTTTAPAASVSAAATDSTTHPPRGNGPPDAALKLGRRAQVSMVSRQHSDVPVTMAVTRVRQGKIADLDGFVLGPRLRSAHLFYVHVWVKNATRRDLGGRRVVLFGQVSPHRVVQPVRFGPSYPLCDDKTLPAKFAEGAVARVCLVMAVPDHGQLLSVQWRGGRGDEATIWALR